jgi:hypothetical protein
MNAIDLAYCLLQNLSRKLITDCSESCPDTDNTKIIEDFRLTESLLAQLYMIKDCEGEEANLSKIEFALTNLIEKHQCAECLSFNLANNNNQPNLANTSNQENGNNSELGSCGIEFQGDCKNLNIIAGGKVKSISYNNGSGDVGISCPIQPTNIGDQTGNVIDAKFLCMDGIPSEKPEECNMVQVNENTLIYVYYDGTSLGQTQIENAYIALMDWLHQQPGFIPVTATPSGNVPNTPSPGENVFHTTIQGERWLDWGIQPMTGEFNNSNVTEDPLDPLYSCSFITQGDQLKGKDRIVCGSLATAASNWSYDTNFINLPTSGVSQTVHQFYDNVTGAFLGDNVIDFDNNTCASGDACDPNLVCFTANDPNQHVWVGPPPAAPVDKDVLVIIFADESDCAYHGGLGSTGNYVQTFFDDRGSYCLCNEEDFGFGATVNPPTTPFKLDYDEYVAQYSARQSNPNAGNYRCFIYPSCPNSVVSSHMPFPLHIAGAIDSGDGSPADGRFEEVNLPASSLYDPLRGCGGSSTDPYGGGKLILKRGTDINPYFDQGYGGLDQYGWGYNPEMVPFNNAIFARDLFEFLSEGTEPVCSGFDCLTVRIYDAENPGTPVVGEVVNVNGTPYTTNALGNFEVSMIDPPGTVTIGYENSECYTFESLGNCTQYIVTAYKGTKSYDTCVLYTDVQCGCGPNGGFTSDIVINTGTNMPQDIGGDGIIGTITNETTGVVTEITTDMVVEDGSGNYKVIVSFTDTNDQNIPDGRYTIVLEAVGEEQIEFKDCKLILCQSSTEIQELFKKFVTDRSCCPCPKPFENFVKAYALFRALRVLNLNDCNYEDFIDDSITRLKELIEIAKTSNCKNC